MLSDPTQGHPKASQPDCSEVAPGATEQSSPPSSGRGAGGRPSISPQGSACASPSSGRGPGGRFKIVIPARYASSRLPGKPLADIGGKPMVLRVVDAVADCGADGIWVATDDERVRQVVESAGQHAVMTRADHPSGTDRIAEVAAQLGWQDDDIVVNVQGDEPLIDPALVSGVAAALAADPVAAIATAAHSLHSAEEFFNPNVVKVVCDAAGRAHYFSRAPIPYARDAFALSRDSLPEGLGALRHIGIYAYRVSFLHRYGSLPPAPTEQWESLEQLRALWHGFPIRVLRCAEAPMAGVDTAEDLMRVQAVFAAKQRGKSCVS